MRKIIILAIFLLGWLPPAKAFFLGGFIKIISLPVRVPLKIAGFMVKKTTTIATRGTKSALSNISVSTGPFKVRPFDFQG